MPETTPVPSNMDNFIREFPEKEKKRSPNGFIKYRTIEWQKFKKEFPNVTTQQFSSIAAKKWHDMSDNEKNHYIKLPLEKRTKTNNRNKTKRKHRKTKKKEEIEQYIPTECPPSQIEFNNYNENLHITDYEEYILLTDHSYPLYYDTNPIYDDFIFYY
jgi:hypothetical protein